MKCTLFNAVAIAASLGLASTALAQYQTSARYSSYGRVQEAQQEASPSDIVVPPVVNPADQSTVESGSSDENGSYYGNSSNANCAVGGDLIHNNDRNVVFGLRALIFDRNYEDQRLYGTNAFGESLYSTASDLDDLNGFEAVLGVRNCNGCGWEVGYWGLYPDQADYTFTGPPFTTGYTGLADVSLAGSQVDLAFNTADTWRTYRDNDIQSFEVNLLRNGGCVQGFCCGTLNIEWLAGFRYFEFDEDIRLAAFNSTGVYPPQTFYDVSVDNQLLGFQLGARADRCIGWGFSLLMGCKFGLYNNDVDARQAIHDGAGTYGVVTAGPYAGSDYNLSASEDELATMGEFDLGLNWQISECWRANFGYRVYGVTGVALAPDQIPTNFQNFDAINNVRTNGDLLLHGAYFGLEKAF